MYARNPMLEESKRQHDLVLKKNTSLDDAEPKLLTGETYLDVLYDEWIMKLKDSGVSKG